MIQTSTMTYAPGHGPRLYRNAGRRELRAQLEERFRFITLKEEAQVLQTRPMAPRAERRAAEGEFQPIYGYRGVK